MSASTSPTSTSPVRSTGRRPAPVGPVRSDVLATPFGRITVPAPVAVSFSDLPFAGAAAVGPGQQLRTPWDGTALPRPSVVPVSFSSLPAPVLPAVPAPRTSGD
jgi:hypothetical protein